MERLKSIDNNIGHFLAKMLNRKHCQRHHGSESCVLLINQRLILSQFLVPNAVNGGPSKLRNLYSDVPPPTHKKHKSWKSSCGYKITKLQNINQTIWRHHHIMMPEKLCLQWNDFKENVMSAFGNMQHDKEALTYVTYVKSLFML